MHTREKIDYFFGYFFFFNDIPMYVAQSPYFVMMMSMVVKERGPSYFSPSDHKLRTMPLDRAYERVRFLMEKMNACWIESGHNNITDGWKNISHHSLINIMVTCTYCQSGLCL